MSVRVVLERGPKGKRSVAYAVDFPGWARGAKTPELALQLLEDYRSRYRPVAAGARLAGELDGPLEVVEERVGTGMTDFWGISFSSCSLEVDPMPADELKRKLALLQACWKLFDKTAASVSAEMQKGPRGGGRDRDTIIRHTIRNESEVMAKRIGVLVPEMGAMTPEGLKAYRRDYLATMRAYNAGEGKRMRNWTLPFLIRHSAFHTMDHTWEMQDKDLTQVRR
jgi:hypothetical protein